MKSNEYQCAQCGGIFEKGLTDEEAIKEAEQKFPDHDLEDMELVCDDCYKQLVAVNEN